MKSCLSQNIKKTKTTFDHITSPPNRTVGKNLCRKNPVHVELDLQTGTRERVRQII